MVEGTDERERKSKLLSLCKHFKFPSSCEAPYGERVLDLYDQTSNQRRILFFLDVKKLLLGK